MSDASEILHHLLKSMGDSPQDWAPASGYVDHIPSGIRVHDRGWLAEVENRGKARWIPVKCGMVLRYRLKVTARALRRDLALAMLNRYELEGHDPCEPCSGLGRSGDTRCSTCNGTGVTLLPMPQPRSEVLLCEPLRPMWPEGLDMPVGNED